MPNIQAPESEDTITGMVIEETEFIPALLQDC